MDSEGTLGTIRVIEFPVENGKLVQEIFYEDYLFNHPEIISKNLTSFARQFRIGVDETRHGIIDLLFIKNETLIIGEVKKCRLDELENIRKNAIIQITRYIMTFEYFKPIIREDIILKGLILIFVEGRKLRKEYDINDLNNIEEIDMNNYPQLPVYPKTDIIKTQRNILKALKGNVKQLKKQRNRLEESIKKQNKKIKDSNNKIKENLMEIQTILHKPLNKIIDFINEKDNVIKVIAKGSNILKINSILREEGITYFAESESGFYMEESLNDNKEAVFYLPSKIQTQAFVKIQRLGELTYYQTHVHEHLKAF